MIPCLEATRAVDEAPIVRREVHRRLDATTRIAMMIAPPGYGKTTALRQWLDTPRGPSDPTAFIQVGRIDGGGVHSFWRHVLVQLDEVWPGLEPELVALPTDPAPDQDVLGALVSWIERANVRANVILDDLASLEDRAVLDGLALLVERVGDRVRLIVSGRGEPALPLARWRSRGWVTHVGEADLSFDDADARHLARSMGSRLDAAEVAALNRTVEGWPLGLHLALLAATEPTDVVAGLHRRVRDHVVAEVVDLLPERQRHVAYALSVPSAFDLELSRLLLGDESVPVVRELLRLGIFLRIDDGQHGVMRYHGLVRAVLERELREREPVWHEQLVGRVASISVERGDLAAPPLPHATRIRQPVDGPSMGYEHPVLVVAAAGLRRGSVAAADPPPATSLTAREQSLLEFLPSHLSYAQIAARTFLSVNTVKSNLKSIYRKLGVASRAEAVDLARDAGLI